MALDGSCAFGRWATGVQRGLRWGLQPGGIEGSSVLRIGGSAPGLDHCTREAMSGWLSEFIVRPLAKPEEELRVIKTALLGYARMS
mmetsp:Transcript_18577/g.24977  ORF Transcript_18577/g.24977 Transcript_18577/m.24977 type:complete len:86 (+) Transcript_18577:94-351(+)